MWTTHHPGVHIAGHTRTPTSPTFHTSIMKTSGSTSFLAMAVLFALSFCIGCSGGITEPVTPQVNTNQTPISNTNNDGSESDDENNGTNDSGFDDIETTTMEEIAIDAVPCNPDSRSRASALMVYSLNSFNMDVFAQDRYDVRWYSFEGATLSETNRLECVAGGTFFVDIIDQHTQRTARATITL